LRSDSNNNKLHNDRVNFLQKVDDIWTTEISIIYQNQRSQTTNQDIQEKLWNNQNSYNMILNPSRRNKFKLHGSRNANQHGKKRFRNQSLRINSNWLQHKTKKERKRLAYPLTVPPEKKHLASNLLKTQRKTINTEQRQDKHIKQFNKVRANINRL